jgi:hypothetical protein
VAGSLLAESQLPRREVVLISDFQRSGWRGQEGTALPAGATLTPMAIQGTATQPNLSVTAVSLQRSRFANQERVTVTAGITNRSETAVTNQPVTLEAGGLKVSNQTFSVEGGASTSVTFEPVTISGGRTVSGWRPDPRQKGLWRADVGGLDTRQLYVNDRRANRPTAAIPGTLTLTDTGYTTTNAVPQTWRNPGDIEFVYRYSYVEGRCGVAGISGTPAQTAITMDQPCWGMAKALYGTDALAFVHEAENSPGFLTRPGDWYLDRSRPGHHELLYLRRAGEDMRRATVVAPVLESLVIGNGVHDLGFRGLTFAYATWLAPNSPAGFPAAWSMYMRPEGLHTVPGAVAFHTAERVTFEGNQFTHLGGQGLELSKSSSYNVVSGNVFTDISDGGILIGVVPPDETGTNRGNRISDNWIHRVGVEYRAASGIWDTATQHTTIAHNQVNDVPYTGILSGPSEDLRGIMRGNRILDNRVSGTAVQNIKLFKEIWGEKGLASVVLATTMWDIAPPTIAETREKELITEEKFWGRLIEHGMCRDAPE